MVEQFKEYAKLFETLTAINEKKNCAEYKEAFEKATAIAEQHASKVEPTPLKLADVTKEKYAALREEHSTQLHWKYDATSELRKAVAQEWTDTLWKQAENNGSCLIWRRNHATETYSLENEKAKFYDVEKERVAFGDHDVLRQNGLTCCVNTPGPYPCVPYMYGVPNDVQLCVIRAMAIPY
jgi:hypothetical protein